MKTPTLKLMLAALAVAAIGLTPKAWATGELPGVFSVSATNKVQFSQGNLQAVFDSAGSSCTWQFAANQYDYVGYAAANNNVTGNGSVSVAGTVDLFGWSTASTYYGINNSSDANDYSGDFVDWGNLAISNGGNTENSGWRTLTRDEWAYLFSNHTFGFATVAGVKGIIIAPDNYTGPAIDSNHRNGQDSFANNTIDASTWAGTYVPAGVVFLPAAGFRLPWIGQVQENGYYWSSSAVGGDSNNRFAILLGLVNAEFQINVAGGGNWPANDGFSVRLVKNVFTLLPGTQTEGPWTFNAANSQCVTFTDINSISYNSLNGSSQGAITQLNNSNGLGFTANGSCDSKEAIFSFYTCSQSVPSYSRLKLTWNYEIHSHYDLRAQQAALYAHTNESELKDQALDFTTANSTDAGSAYCIGLIYHGYPYQDFSQSYNHDFIFDNSNGSSQQTKTWYLILTQIINDVASAGVYNGQWATFKSTGTVIAYDYYKYITYDPNGGSGSMSEQEIENSGTLRANTFTRYGYTFAGWATSPNGSVIYADEAAITATESDKGPVTLYAQWVLQAEQCVGKVIATDGKLYKTVAAAEAAGTTPSGVVAYWGAAGSVEASNSSYRGLAISLADVAEGIPWCTDPSAWFAGSTLEQALEAKNGWERTESFGRPGSRDVEDNYGHHHNHQAAAAVYDYNVSRPSGSSPWFVPTMGQWNLVAQGLTGSAAVISETDNPDYTYSDLSTKLRAAGAAKLNWAIYWSSTEVDGTSMWTFDLGGISGSRNGSHARSVAKTSYEYEVVRAFFAFESATLAEYTVCYDANGGSGEPAAQAKDGGIDLTLSSTVPTRAGYTFAGWNTTADGSGASYAAGATFTLNADTTLYAQWMDAYEAWAAENGITGAWNETSGGIYNVFRYVFGQPMGDFALITGIAVGESKVVITTPAVVNIDGVAVSVVESSDLAGETVTDTKALEAEGRAEFTKSVETPRFYRLKAEEAE